MKLAIPILSAALLLTAAVILLNLPEAPPEAPETPAMTLPDTISLFITAENRIITLDYNDYVIGCVMAQLPGEYSPETMRAAVRACSSSAAYFLENNDRSQYYGADLSDSPKLCQPYIGEEEAREKYGTGYEALYNKLRAAAENDSANILTYNGKPAYLPMCTVSCGKTDDGGKPYLPSKTLKDDKKSEDFTAKVSLTSNIVRRKIIDAIGSSDSLTLFADCSGWFSSPERLDSGTLSTISFGGRSFTGEELREIFGLQSAAIYIEYFEERFRITTRGCGGNTGMSLYSAERMAKGGADAGKILAYFYPGTEPAEARITVTRSAPQRL